MSEITVRVADWHRDNAELRRIRDSVFVAEQSVPPELEWDAEDADAVHFLAEEGDYPVGTARLLPDGHIGRVSVLGRLARPESGRKTDAGGDCRS